MPQPTPGQHRPTMDNGGGGADEVGDLGEAKNEDSVKGGYTYITEFQRGSYCIEITENMGFWSIEKSISYC